MTEPPPDFDLNTPSLDRGHEAIRIAVLEAIADVGDNSRVIAAVRQVADTARTEIAALRQRVKALEDAANPTP